MLLPHIMDPFYLRLCMPAFVQFITSDGVMNDEEEGTALSISVGGTSNSLRDHIYAKAPAVTLILLARVS